VAFVFSGDRPTLGAHMGITSAEELLRVTRD
jgi:hypothetical protein